MSDFISREAAIKRMHEWIPESIKPLWKQPIEEFEKILKSPSIPDADVRPVVRGHWEQVMGKYDLLVRCNKCHYIPIDDLKMVNFCPNCGADMREVEHGS